MVRTARILVVAALAVIGSALIAIRFVSAAPAPGTVVSITFDDGSASQFNTLSMLRRHHMTGTYYINSEMVGSGKYYMTWDQIHALAIAGNEIGGHTLHHENLRRLSPSKVRAEICDDRTNLINQGFSPISFAYPEAAVDSIAERTVHDCGYTNARDVGNLYGRDCPCPYSESTPPPDPYRLRTLDGATSSTTLEDLKSGITNAETHGGGWVTLVFHGICDDKCTSDNSVSPSIFTALLNWLEPRRDRGTVVRTVGEVMNGARKPVTAPPTTTPSCNGAPCFADWYTGRVKVRLTATVGSTGAPIAATWYTTDGSDPVTSRSRKSYSKPFDVTRNAEVKFFSTDVSGAREQTRTEQIEVDTRKPTVAFITPRSGTAVRAGTNVMLLCSAKDVGSGMYGVTFYLDGEKLDNAGERYEYTWDTRGVAVGPHLLTAVASDVANNKTTSATVTLIVNPA